MISIGNNGEEIISTNYWESDVAKRGFCYLSGNAGHWRLLIPKSFPEAVSEFRKVREASIEPSIAIKGHIDVIAEDGSSSPYCISLSRQMIDRSLVRKRCRLLVYSEGELVTDIPLRVQV
ncbi:hypothetical protein [Limimaricola soesokkakensis]|uniref:hypothetical protein n=1 Tax=Limimaricola soesokkakensis TaxID=1343159 RepID=UPI003516929E